MFLGDWMVLLCVMGYLMVCVVFVWFDYVLILEWGDVCGGDIW